MKVFSPTISGNFDFHLCDFELCALGEKQKCGHWDEVIYLLSKKLGLLLDHTEYAIPRISNGKRHMALTEITDPGCSD